MRASGGLASHLALEATTLATCWRIVRQDGAIYTFTDHDEPLLIGGEVYRAAGGFMRSAIQQQANGSVDNVDMEGLADTLGITEDDVRRGLWDYAEIRLFACNWQAPDAGQMKLRRGWIGEVVTGDLGSVNTTLRGLAQLLAQRVGAFYSPTCRTQLGDDKCKVDLAAFTHTGAVAASPASSTRFLASGLPGVADYYTAGVLIFTSGLNLNVRREVLDWTGSMMTLFLPPPYVTAAGDTFTVTAGCQKRLDEDCVAKFGNAVNFRGEPFVPGANTLLFAGFPAGAGAAGKK